MTIPAGTHFGRYEVRSQLGAGGMGEVYLAHDTQLDRAVARRVVVAKSGGDFTTISAALAGVTPSASARYVIDVMPGTYVESVAMKSWVHLRGAGPGFSTLQAPSASNCFRHCDSMV